MEKKKGSYEWLVSGRLLETPPARLSELRSRCPVQHLEPSRPWWTCSRLQGCNLFFWCKKTDLYKFSLGSVR